MNRKSLALGCFNVCLSARGMGLIDTLIALVLSALLVLMVAASFQVVGRTSIKAREQLASARLAQSIESRLSAVNFYDILPVDSSLKKGRFSGHPLTHFAKWSGNPLEPVLNDIERQVLAKGFTRFTFDVTYLRRDSSDNDDDGSNMDFISFHDGNNDYRDDNDPNVGFIQRTTPAGDFFGTGLGPDGTTTLPEVPDTHLKQVTLRLWKGKTAVVVRQSGILSQEGWTGDEGESTQSPIKLVMTTPALSIKLFQIQNPEQYNAQQPFLVNEFPQTYKDKSVQEVDSNRPLILAGKTAPGARLVFVHRLVSYPPVVYGNFGPCHDDFADNDGNFKFTSYNCTPRFIDEGLHTISVRAEKDGLYSPYYGRALLLDVKAPVIDKPTLTANTLSPVVRARIRDLDTAGKKLYSSGLRLGAKNWNAQWGTFQTAEGANNSIAFLTRNNGSAYAGVPTVVTAEPSVVPNEPIAYWIEWVSKPSMLPPALPGNGLYSVAAEGADNAMYRTRKEWDLTVTADMSDVSAPPLPTAYGPVQAQSSRRPTFYCQLIEDPESGLNPYSLDFKLTLNNTPPTPPVTADLVNKTLTPVLRNYYNPHTLRFTYTPAVDLPSGNYTASLTISNWAGVPLPITWDFSVP